MRIDRTVAKTRWFNGSEPRVIVRASLGLYLAHVAAREQMGRHMGSVLVGVVAVQRAGKALAGAAARAKFPPVFGEPTKDASKKERGGAETNLGVWVPIPFF
jgi:hypothetical protein